MIRDDAIQLTVKPKKAPKSLVAGWLVKYKPGILLWKFALNFG